MDKKILKTIFCFAVTVVCLLYSCTADNSTEDAKDFEEPVHTENYEDYEKIKQPEQKEENQEQQKSETEIDGVAPAEDEYEPEIYDGY